MTTFTRLVLASVLVFAGFANPAVAGTCPDKHVCIGSQDLGPVVTRQRVNANMSANKAACKGKWETRKVSIGHNLFRNQGRCVN